MGRGVFLAERTEPRREVMPVAPPEGPAEVWALEEGAWHRVAGPMEPGDAAAALRRWAHVPACTVRGGTPCAVTGHVTGARLAALRPALAEARRAAQSEDEGHAKSVAAAAPRCLERNCRAFATSTGRCPSHERAHQRRIAQGAPSNDAAPAGTIDGATAAAATTAPGDTHEHTAPTADAAAPGDTHEHTAPTADAAAPEEDERTMAKTKTKRRKAAKDDTQTTQTTEAPAACEAHECDAEAGKVRADTNPLLAGFCPPHRQRARERTARWGVSVEEAAQTLRDGVTEQPGGGEVETSKREVKSKTTQRPAPQRPRVSTATATATATSSPRTSSAPAAVDGLSLVQRMGAVIRRLGGLDAAEALADELARLGAP